MSKEYNAVGWFEIHVQDMDRAKKFYEGTFGVEGRGGAKAGYISAALGIKTLTIGGSPLGGRYDDTGVITTGGALGFAMHVFEV